MKRLLVTFLSLLILVAIASPGSAEKKNATVDITDIHGTTAVPINPEVVVSLDNRTFDTLYAWGIRLAAVPRV